MIEFGSDFNYIPHYSNKTFENNLTWGNLVGNGRQAIYKVLQIYDIKNIWLPSYFCYDVIPYLDRKVNVKYYHSNPKLDIIDLTNYEFNHGEAILLVDYFGFNNQYQLPSSAEKAIVIEDKSHNVRSININKYSDYIVASLRKSLPIPDGGFLKKTYPYVQPLPIDTNNTHNTNSLQRLEAMFLKSMYLETKIKDQNLKKIFREKYIKSEEALNNINISEISDFSIWFLKYFNFNDWFDQKKKNLQYLIKTLKEIEGFEIVNSYFQNTEDHIGLILEFPNNNDRDFYRQKMIENNIYPAILWDIPKFNKSLTTDFDKRSLMLHCDARYNQNEIKQLANIIININNDRNNRYKQER